MRQDAPRATGAGGDSLAPESRVLRGYATAGDARRYAAKTRKGPLRRLSAARERALALRGLRSVARGGAVLDVPCGAGRLLPAVLASGRRAVGADLSREMLALARDAGAPLVRASAGALPFRRGAFEAALCVRLLHHYGPEDRGRILREIARVSAGRVVVTVFDAGSIKHRRRLRRESRRGRPSLRFGVDLGPFREEIRAAGLEVRAVRHLLRGYAELTFVECQREAPDADLAGSRRTATATAAGGERDR